MVAPAQVTALCVTNSNNPYQMRPVAGAARRLRLSYPHGPPGIRINLLCWYTATPNQGEYR